MGEARFQLRMLSPEVMSRILVTAVVGVDVEEVGLDAGILGELARVRLDYASAGSGPPSVIVKVPTGAPPNRAVGMAFGFYEREWRFYTELAERVGMAVP